MSISWLSFRLICDYASNDEERLARLTGSPVVELNRAIAIAEIEGPETCLRIIDQLSPSLSDFRYLQSTKAELLRRLRIDEAREAYVRAKFLTDDGAERRLTELASAMRSA